MERKYDTESLETAACVWEAVLDILNGSAGEKGLRKKAQRIRENLGTAELRCLVLRWVDLIDAEWAKVKEDYDGPFDWEFVPDWIASNIDWTGDRPIYKLGGR